MYDILIIGSGIIGSSIARELARYKAKILVLEKNSDVSCGTTKANSGIIHAGFDAKPNTNKALYNVLGSKMYENLARELDFPYRKNGAFVLSFNKEDHGKLVELLDKAKLNGVSDCVILSGDEIRKMEPNISLEVAEGLYAPNSAIASPYEMCIALAENAYTNGVKFEFRKEVIDIKRKDDHFIVKTKDDSIYEALVVINASGTHSDEINNIVSSEKYKIIPRKGEYVLLDKEYSYICDKTLFQLPTKMGKGILVSPTTHGNIIVGPTAIDIDSKDDTHTTYEGLSSVWANALKTIPSLPKGGIITQFSGIRAHLETGDFIIGFSKDVKGLYNLVGIESPGLASAPAIAKKVSLDVKEYLSLEKSDTFNPYRKAIKRVTSMTNNELEKAIKENPLYGHIVCRCEIVSEAEIVEAINRQPGATDLDGVKRRVRAGMGRCQMGFCTPKIMEILHKELNIDMKDVTKRGEGSNVIVSKIKD